MLKDLIIMFFFQIMFRFFSFSFFFYFYFMQYDFEGNRNIIKFLKTIQEAGLFAVLRIGPYACAEWNCGYLQI